MSGFFGMCLFEKVVFVMRGVGDGIEGIVVCMTWAESFLRCRVGRRIFEELQLEN